MSTRAPWFTPPVLDSPSTNPRHVRTPPVRWLVGFIVVALMAVGCASTDPDASTASDDFPSWLEEVTPPPGATYAPNQGVSARFSLPTDPDVVTQLLIDGVDVSAASVDGTGLLRYDEASDLVPLGEGDHRATIQRVIIPSDGLDDVVADSYTWEFRVG
jgi:hypothetical protein